MWRSFLLYRHDLGFIPLLTTYARLPENSHEQIGADVSFVRIRYGESEIALRHILMFATRVWPSESEFFQPLDQFFSFDGFQGGIRRQILQFRGLCD